MVNRILALCAILIAALFAASNITGCDGDNGVVTTDDVIEDTNSLCPSGYYLADNYWCLPLDTGSDTTSDTGPSPCEDWEWLEGTVWTCQPFEDPTDCTMTLWVEEDDDGVEHCVADCDWFGRYVEVLRWGPPPPTSFILPAAGSRPDTTCNLKEE